MALACDGAPVEHWHIAWNAVGPFRVDSWDTSYNRADGSPKQAHRVVGKHGFQCSTDRGNVIQYSLSYAQAIADAANAGLLSRQAEPKRARP